MTLTLGASASMRLMMRCTSSSRSGVGLVPMPTKPVTPGVLRTTYHESSRQGHLDQDVARKDAALIGAPLPVAHLDLFFGGDDDLKI